MLISDSNIENNFGNWSYSLAGQGTSKGKGAEKVDQITNPCMPLNVFFALTFHLQFGCVKCSRLKIIFLGISQLLL